MGDEIKEVPADLTTHVVKEIPAVAEGEVAPENIVQGSGVGGQAFEPEKPVYGGAAAAIGVGVPLAKLTGEATAARDAWKFFKGAKGKAAPIIDKFMNQTPAEKWNQKMHGVEMPHAEMNKGSFDIGQQMKGVVGPGGELQGGSIHGGIMVGPEATRQIEADRAAAINAERDAETMRQANRNVRQRINEGWNVQKEKLSAASPVGSYLANKALTAGKQIGGSFGAGYNATDLYNRAMQGEIPQAAVSTAGLAGSVANMLPGKKLHRLGAAAAVGAPIVNTLIDAAQGHAAGGTIKPVTAKMANPDLLMQSIKAVNQIKGPVAHLSGGGQPPVGGKYGKAYNAGEKIFGKLLETPIATNKAVRASEALNPHINKYLGLTQSDNMGIIENRMGGKQFPLIQHVSPEHAENRVVWMTDSEPHSNALVKHSYNKDKPVVWSTYIGAPDQLKSNKTVSRDVYNEFLRGDWTPEQYEAVNNRIATMRSGPNKALVYPQPFDIRDKFATEELGMDTFARRGALASMLGEGEGIGRTRGGIFLPNYQEILKAHRDPMTVGSDTGAVGSRLFTVDKTPSQFSKGFHPDYDWTVHGEDAGVSFGMIPQELAIPEFYNAYRVKNPTRGAPVGNAMFGYNNAPQLITEPYLESLYKAGYKKGGSTNMPHRSNLPQDQYLMGATDPTIEAMKKTHRVIKALPKALGAAGKAAMPTDFSAEGIYESPAAQIAMSIPARFNTPIMVNDAVQSAIRGDTSDAAMNAGMAAAPWLGRAGMGALGGLGALFYSPEVNAGEEQSALSQIQPYEEDLKRQVPLSSREFDMGNLQHFADGRRVAKAATPMIEAVEDIFKPVLGGVQKAPIVPGAPHTYGPQATGQWMREYQPSTVGTGLPTTPEEWDALAQARQAAQNKVDYSMGNTGPVKPPLVQYMGKYRQGTPEERAAQRQSDIDTIRMLQKLRGME